MRIILYFILFTFICFSFSCSKGDFVKDPEFGKISITDFTSQQVTVVQGENQPFDADGKSINLRSGKNRFRFYQHEALLLDTLLAVEPYVTKAYVMLKTGDDAELKIYDSSLNGFDKQALPDSGYVKFSFANFSGTLPSKVNVYVNTSTGASNLIQVGRFINVSAGFSDFQQVKLGFDQLTIPVNIFSLVIQDPVSQEILSTQALTLPIGNSSGEANALSATVFLIYINPSNTPTIFMQK